MCHEAMKNTEMKNVIENPVKNIEFLFKKNKTKN